MALLFISLQCLQLSELLLGMLALLGQLSDHLLVPVRLEVAGTLWRHSSNEMMGSANCNDSGVADSTRCPPPTLPYRNHINRQQCTVFKLDSDIWMSCCSVLHHTQYAYNDTSEAIAMLDSEAYT